MTPNAQGARPTVAGQTNSDPDQPSLAAGLLRTGRTAAWAVAPFFAGCLMFGWIRSAFSLAGGAVISVVVCAFLKHMVYRTLAVVSPSQSGPRDPAVMLKFVMAGIAKFVLVIGLVCGLVALHVNLYALLAGFVIAHIAITVVAAREMAKS